MGLNNILQTNLDFFFMPGLCMTGFTYTKILTVFPNKLTHQQPI